MKKIIDVNGIFRFFVWLVVRGKFIFFLVFEVSWYEGWCLFVEFLEGGFVGNRRFR